MSNSYLHSTRTHHVYEFDCPGCGVTGEIGIPVGSTAIVDHECGTLFIQQPVVKGMFGHPSLIEICHPGQSQKGVANA